MSTDLKRLPDQTLLIAWANYEGSDRLPYLTDFINGLGYAAYTSKHPNGRPVSRLDTRRLLRTALQKHPLYPLHRAPTAADYDKIRVDVLAQYYAEDMV